MSLADGEPLYEHVGLLAPGRARPVVLIGAHGVGKRDLQRQLVRSAPDRYATPIPHTRCEDARLLLVARQPVSTVCSRKPRGDELNGVDYWFCTRAEMQALIDSERLFEFGQLQGNLYGTTLDALDALLTVQRTPVVAVSTLLALHALRRPRLKPIVVLVEAPSFELFRQTRGGGVERVLRASSRSNAQERVESDFASIVEHAEQMSDACRRYADASVVNGVLADCTHQLACILRDYETLNSWAPIAWSD